MLSAMASFSGTAVMTWNGGAAYEVVVSSLTRFSGEIESRRRRRRRRRERRPSTERRQLRSLPSTLLSRRGH